MAGTDQDQISYDLASSLLGYTHGALLDDVVDAFASGDAATVFRAVDRVIQTGQDPRRFVEDLLERFRDLVIVDAVPENAGNILHGTPEDQIARLRNQAHQMGASELSRCADITNEALTEMVGPPPRSCTWSCCAPGCCCPRRRTPPAESACAWIASSDA